MLFIYTKTNSIRYFTTQISEKVILPDKLYTGKVNINNYQYVVGNDLVKYSPKDINQIFIDVIKLGLSYELLDKYGMESIVYTYNNWYIPENPYMRVDIPFSNFTVAPITITSRYKSIELLPGNKRFNQIANEISNYAAQEGFIGAIWPTCHYLTDTSHMTIITT